MERIDITTIPMNERTDELWLRYKIQCYEGALDLVRGVQCKDVDGMNDKMYAIKAIMIELEPLRRGYEEKYGR